MVPAIDPWGVSLFVLLAVIYGVSARVASLADNYVDPLFIWGGMDCTTTQVIEACAGVVPAGFMLISVAVAAVVVSGVGWLVGGGGDA